jgi:hypothetical protein
MKLSKVQRRVEAAFGRALSDRRFQFARAVYGPGDLDYRRWMAPPWNMSEEEARAQYDRFMAQEVWRSDTYQVAVMQMPCPLGFELTQLSIKRNDREAFHDWRELQQIKNAIVGPEREAVELYPAESRLMDTANQYWLYVLPEGLSWPFGFELRAVTEDEPGNSKQRPFERAPA